MLHIEQRLSLFRDMIGCCHNLFLWSYSRDMTLLNSNCPESGILNELFVSSKQLAELPETLSSKNHPVMMSNELGLMWITVPESTENILEHVHVLGPFFLYDISAAQIEAELNRRKLMPELRRSVMDFVRSLPVISLNRAVEYAQMLHFCVTGAKTEVEDIQFLDNRAEPSPEEELSTVHGTYEAEREMVRLVREGDLNYKNT